MKIYKPVFQREDNYTSIFGVIDYSIISYLISFHVNSRFNVTMKLAVKPKGSVNIGFRVL